jgi:hypothetical protein
MDIGSEDVNVEYYARDMKFEAEDSYPLACDLQPSYTFQITQKKPAKLGHNRPVEEKLVLNYS